MAKKKPTAKKDRHTSRVLVGIPGDVHRQLKKLAEKNGRPLTWELRALIVKALETAGLWPGTPTS